MDDQARELVDFWRDAGPAKWFARDAAFDRACESRFLATHLRAARGELDAWADNADGALALVLALDQIPRNVYRGSAHAFATDALARNHAEAAIARGFDLQVDAALRMFFYLPFEHSETPADQDRAVALIGGLPDKGLLKWAQLHQDVIARFGRFPHRNAVLGRESTAEELTFLREGGFSA